MVITLKITRNLTTDNKLSLTWANHLSELKNGFVSKLNLLKRSRHFLSRPMRLDLYNKVILLSILYAITVWGSCANKQGFDTLEVIHRRAARIIHDLPRDMPLTVESSFRQVQFKLATLMYNIYHQLTPSCMESIINRRSTVRDNFSC